MTRSIALTIAGSDSSGGAGIQADLKTFTAFGVYGASAIAAVTAQNTRGVSGVYALPPTFLAEQIDRVAEDLTVGATKTGMLATAEIVATVAERIAHHRAAGRLGLLVVDPVMVATSGDVLLDAGAIDTLCGRLLPLATLVTPNLEEAAILLGEPIARSVADMRRQVCEIQSRFGPSAVLVKGGHGFGPDAIDVLCLPAAEVIEFRLSRLSAGPLHGTGCTLSAAITALVASNVPLPDAISRAKTFLWRAIEASIIEPLGEGAHPVDHLFAIRRSAPPA